VIIEVNNLVELYEKLGIGSEVIKSGEHKDMGNPARPLKSFDSRELMPR
jgi:protease-4